MDFGKTLKKRRSELNLTQEEIAKKIYVTRQTISNWENGKSYPDLDMLIKISDVYQVSIDSLLKGDQDLKKSLDTQKVKSILIPLGYLPTLLIATSMILDAVAPRNIWVLTGSLFLTLISVVVTIIQGRMNSYISGEDDGIKYYFKLIGILAVVVILFSAILIFIFGLHTTSKILTITMIVVMVLSVGLQIYSYILEKKDD